MTATGWTVMQELSKPFPDKYVHENPSGGGSYIKHHVIEQRLIQVFGRPPSFERVEIVFGDVAAIEPNPKGKSDRAKNGSPALKNVVVAVVCRMSIEVDGEKWVAEEAGDCEEPHNWKTDGQRLKDAMSDAYKRCAMRWGCGLHLWSQGEYFLHDALSRNEAGGIASESTPDAPPSTELASSTVAPPQTSGEGSQTTSSSPSPTPSPENSESPARPSQTETPDAPRTAGAGTQAGTEVGDSATVAGGGGNESSAGRGSASEPGSASSGNASQLADAILNSVDAGVVKINSVLVKANHLANDAEALPLASGGLSRSNLHELPESVLKDLVRELNISQEALSV